MLLYYRGLRSVEMIFTDYSQHIPKITASPVCTAIKNAINDINVCLSFSHGLKFQVGYLKMLQLLGDSVPRPSAGGSPLDPTGGFPSPRPPDLPTQLHLLDPPCYSMW